MDRYMDAQRLLKKTRETSTSSTNQRNQNANNANTLKSRNQSRAQPSNSRSKDPRRTSHQRTKITQPPSYSGKQQTLPNSNRTSSNTNKTPLFTTLEQKLIRAKKEKEFEIMKEMRHRKLATVTGTGRVSKRLAKDSNKEPRAPVNRDTTRDKERAGFRHLMTDEFCMTLDIERVSKENGLEHHRYFRETYRIPCKVKAATSEKVTGKISFSNRRKTCDFTFYDKEDKRVRFTRNAPSRLIRAAEDNDCDTDDEQINVAVEQCFKEFRKALFDAQIEHKRKNAQLPLNTARSTSAVPNGSNRYQHIRH